MHMTSAQGAFDDWVLGVLHGYTAIKCIRDMQQQRSVVA
jgi:hypothetical protein